MLPQIAMGMCIGASQGKELHYHYRRGTLMVPGPYRQRNEKRFGVGELRSQKNVLNT